MTMRDAEVFAARVDALVASGNAIPVKRDGGSYARFGPFQGWRTQVLSWLGRTIGAEDVYCREFGRLTDRTGEHNLRAGIAVLESLASDARAGYLDDLREQVAAAVFTDLLDMAQHLVEESFKDPAASLTGAVLEDSLRRMLVKRGVALRPGVNLNELNDMCVKHGAYGRVAQGQVNGWRVIRNATDHGNFDEYTLADVRSMLQGVRDFLAAQA